MKLCALVIINLLAGVSHSLARYIEHFILFNNADQITFSQ